MPGPKRNEKQRILDKIEMVRLLRRGATQTQIATKLGVSVSQISCDWKVVLREVTDSRNKDIEQLVAIKLEEYSEIKEQAWAAWEKSKEDHQRRVSEESMKGGSLSTRQLEDTQRQCGDSGYLQVVLTCLKAERELQGLNPAKEIKGSMTVINWDVLVNGIPEGPVPDLIEAEIEKAVRGELSHNNELDSLTHTETSKVVNTKES